MPTRKDIELEVVQRQTQSNDTIRRNYLRELHEYTKRDTIVYASGFTNPKIQGQRIPSSFISITTHDIQGFMSALYGLTGKELDLIIHSPGGFLEAADQIVQYLRSKYHHIRAIVPQNAMSAATMICCACDSIVMGKHSAIGPIDPQIDVPIATGRFTAPAHALLEEFEQAKAEVKQDIKTAPLWVKKIESYPPGILNICSESIDLAKNKVIEWLDSYMFKDCKDKKGREIADWLASYKEHKTHGRPINSAMAREKGLKIESLEDNQNLQEKVLSVFHASLLTFDNTNCLKFIENHNGQGSFLNVPVK